MKAATANSPTAQHQRTLLLIVSPRLKFGNRPGTARPAVNAKVAVNGWKANEIHFIRRGTALSGKPQKKAPGIPQRFSAACRLAPAVALDSAGPNPHKDRRI